MSLADSYVAIKGQECETDNHERFKQQLYFYSHIYIYI